jgi:nitrogen-specific signal transduction histidine kinase
MKTLNTKYESLTELKEFVLKHDIAKEEHLLLQIFTGVCDVDFITKLVSDIKTLIPHIKIIGTTTAGEILEGKSYAHTTVLSFSIFEKTLVYNYIAPLGKDSRESAKALINQFDKDITPKVAITFANGLYVNGEDYMEVFNEYDKDLLIAGGLSGDNTEFIRTIVFTQDEVLEEGVVIALLQNDDLEVITNASFGWEQIGKTMTITKCNKNVVYEIDNIPALDIYAKYLGTGVAEQLPNFGIEFPLIIKQKNVNVSRAIVAKNTKDGSLTFAGNFNEGDKVVFGYGNIQSILHDRDDIYSDENIQNSESIFIYSCMARLSLLQNNVDEELLPFSTITNVSGFFTYGEFYSKKDIGKKLLNHTMTILSLSEGCDKKEPKEIHIEYKKERKNVLILKALSHLISQTSKELEEINFSLEEKISREIEANRQKDKALLQQSKLAQMGEMLSMIAHQWRQPLSAISATSGTISLKARMNRLDKDVAMELANSITEYAQHLSSTIDDFRNFFKDDKKKQSITLEEIVIGALNIVESSISSSNIKIVLDINSHAEVATYRNEVMQVVLNIIKNAEEILVEKNIQNPKIDIKVKGFTLIISDNAGGIPEDIIDKIFDPYFSTKTKKDGTGLGLYMSKTIIEEHCGGKLSVCNSKEGAVFTVDLTNDKK